MSLRTPLVDVADACVRMPIGASMWKNRCKFSTTKPSDRGVARVVQPVGEVCRMCSSRVRFGTAYARCSKPLFSEHLDRHLFANLHDCLTLEMQWRWDVAYCPPRYDRHLGSSWGPVLVDGVATPHHWPFDYYNHRSPWTSQQVQLS